VVVATLGTDAPAPAGADARTRLDRLRRVTPAVVSGGLMLVIGLVGAGRAVLSWDEVATADVARRSAGQIWHLMQNLDGVFGPYYLLMHAWTGVAGSTVLALRLPSIVAMAGAAAATGELGRRLFGPATGVLAGLLFCLMPNTSRYAQEARPYAFACLFSVLALILLDRALERPGPARWPPYGFAVLLLGLSHLVALAALGAHLLIVAWRIRTAGAPRRVVLSWSVTVLAALVLLAPVAWLGFRERHVQLYWVPPLSARQVYGFPAGVVGSAPAAWLLLGLVTIAAWRPVRRLVQTLAAAAVPLVTVLVVSALGPSFWVPRYLLIVLPPAAIVAAAGLTSLAADRWPGFRGARGVPVAGPIAGLLAVCAVFALAALPAEVTVRGRTAKNGSDWRSAAAIIRRYQRPGDGIVYTPRSRTLRAGIDYYLRHDPGRPRDVLLLRSAATAGSLRATEYPGTAVQAAGPPRIWLFVAGRHEDPVTVRTDLRPLLHRQYQRVRLWRVNRATLALFARRLGQLRRS
jgi:mannosyltransferase